jgi:hypothetical protein
MTILLPDTSLVWNFHALGRLDLVRNIRDTPAANRKEPGWSVVVHEEAAEHIPDALEELTEIFGEYTSPTLAQQTSTQTLREQLFRKAEDSTRMHMGESETIAIWAEKAEPWDPIVFLTEDRDVALFCWRTHVKGSRASSFAGDRKFVPVTTADVFASGVASGLITKAEWSEMRGRLRDLKQPYIGHGREILQRMNAGEWPYALSW